MSDTPQNRQQQFAQLSDEEQEAALRLANLYRESGRERQFIAEAILYPGPLSDDVKAYLMAFLQIDLTGAVKQSLDDLRRLDNARGDARIEAEALGYDWKRHRNRRKHRDPYRDDLDYYPELLATERRPAPKIAAYIALLHEYYDEEGN